jgi:replicative DNA helicase
MIFNRISGVSSRGLLAVTDALRSNGELERVGGVGRITEIATLPHDEENLKYALDQVLEHSRARQAAKIGQQMHKGEIGLVEALKQLEKLNQCRQQEKSWPNALDESIVTSSDLRDLELTVRRKLLDAHIETLGNFLRYAGIEVMSALRFHDGVLGDSGFVSRAGELRDRA